MLDLYCILKSKGLDGTFYKSRKNNKENKNQIKKNKCTTAPEVVILINVAKIVFKVIYKINYISDD